MNNKTAAKVCRMTKVALIQLKASRKSKSNLSKSVEFIGRIWNWQHLVGLSCSTAFGRFSPITLYRQRSRKRTVPPGAMFLCSAMMYSLAAEGFADIQPSLNFSGLTGLIDMPSGDVQTDGAISVSKSMFGPVGRTTLSFQMAPRLSGNFRYTGIADWDRYDTKKSFQTYYDRSFDIGYQLVKEGKFLPSVKVGFQDVIGTGMFSAEYLTATKTFGSSIKVTTGLGWGRLGSFGSMGTPFGERPAVDVGRGGTPRFGQWFRGDVAPFAGIEWQYSPKLTFKAEYSSDAYSVESDQRLTFDRASPLNFGVEYAPKTWARIGIYSLYGSELGLSAHIVLDPKKSVTGGSQGPGPLPVRARTAAKVWGSDWVTDPGAQSKMLDDLQRILTHDGIIVESLNIEQGTAQIRIRSTKLDNNAQALGRTVRAMTAVLPASIERFELVPMSQGVPQAKIMVLRSDIEQLEFAPGGEDQLINRSEFLDISGQAPDSAVYPDGLYPRFSWNVSPSVATSLFDPENPLRADLRLRARACYDIAPGLVLSGAIWKKLIGNIADSKRSSNSLLPHVRSDAIEYARQADLAVGPLTLAWYAKPAPNLFSRVTVGYLETMYGGVSNELLWQRADKPYALGIEVNYVRQRDFDQVFDFRDYSAVTGHISGYYSFDNGVHAELDIGRYLAGDFGATATLQREFSNGIKMGAFATLTDVPFADFGEGSFDKGVFLELPLAWIVGRPTQKVNKMTLRPILRDGGARLSVEGRLYQTVRKYRQSDLDAAWGRFWR